MFCTNCGEEMRPIDKFCASCGAPAAPRPTRTREAVPSQASAPPTPLQSTVQASRAPMPVAPASAANVTPPAPTMRAAAPPPPLSPQQEQQALLEAEEIASVRGMAPVETLPAEFPPAAAAAGMQRCAFCGETNPARNQFCERCGQRIQSAPAAPPAAHSAWLDVPEPTRRPAAAPAAARTAAAAKAAPAPSPAPAVAPASGRDEDFFYFYDDKSAQKGNGKLLIVLMVVLALGLLGVIYLMSRPSTKSAVSGNVTIVVSPTDAQTVVGGTQDFSATVTGSGDTDVSWSVAEGNAGGTIVNRGAQAQGGSVASLGAYTAPATPGTYHVTATSKADATKSASVEVLVSGK